MSTKEPLTRLNVTDAQLKNVKTAWDGETLFGFSNQQLSDITEARGITVEGDFNKKTLVKAILDHQIAGGVQKTNTDPEDESAEAQAKRAAEKADGAEGKLDGEQDANAELNRQDQLSIAKQAEQREENAAKTEPYSAARGASAEQNRAASRSNARKEDFTKPDAKPDMLSAAAEAALVDRIKGELAQSQSIAIDQAVKAAVADLGISDIKSRLSKVEGQAETMHRRFKAGDTYKGSTDDLGKTPGFEEEAPANGVKAA